MHYTSIDLMIIPNGSRRGRIQNRDYQSPNLVNEVAGVESHLVYTKTVDSVFRSSDWLLNQ